MAPFQSGNLSGCGSIAIDRDIRLNAVNILISNLDGVIKCMLTNFVHGFKLGGERDTSEVRATLRENLERLKEWANKNLNLKFNNDKYKVMGKHNKGLFFQEVVLGKDYLFRRSCSFSV